MLKKMFGKVFSSFKRGGKGFTLVELMIVIAVIALLILVLVPRIGTIKNKSREAGLRSNMLMVEGIVQSVIDDYAASGGAAAIDNLEARIAADITAVSVDNQKIRNPITGNYGVTSTVLDYDTVAVAYSTADDADAGAGIAAAWTDPLADAAGTVAFAAYIDTAATPDKIVVQLIPYGIGGDRLTDLEKIISQ